MNFEGLNIEGDISVNESDLALHSRDASIFSVRPEAVVYPKNLADVGEIVKWVSGQKSSQPGLSLTARAAGTDMSGGPLNESIILDTTKYLNHIIEIGEDWAITEPGAYYRDFEKAAAEKGLLFPSYPASKDICAMGGIVNNNAGGEKSLAYGKTERYVREVSMVLSDGNEYMFGPLTMAELEAKKTQQNFEGQIYREMHALIEQNYDAIQKAKPDVSKNSAGYYLWNVYDKENGLFDLTKLFVGAQGTLGIMTKAKLGLIKPKKYSKLLVVFLKDLTSLGELVNEVLKYKPETFECYDDQTLKIAVHFLPSLMKQLKGGIFSTFLKFLPEAGMVIAGGVPKLVLIAQFTGDDEPETSERLAGAMSAIKNFPEIQSHGIHKIEDAAEGDKYWLIRRESFNILRHHAGVKHTAPFIDDVIVHPAQLPQFLPRLNELISQYKGLTYTIAGHAGDANFHVIPLMDFSKEENRRAIPELSEKVYDLVASMHGSITAEHNDGIIRTPYLAKMYSLEIIELFKKTKNIFDPQNIFNPGKKVGGTLEYALEHIITG